MFNAYPFVKSADLRRIIAWAALNSDKYKYVDIRARGIGRVALVVDGKIEEWYCGEARALWESKPPGARVTLQDVNEWIATHDPYRYSHTLTIVTSGGVVKEWIRHCDDDYAIDVMYRMKNFYDDTSLMILRRTTGMEIDRITV